MARRVSRSVSSYSHQAANPASDSTAVTEDPVLVPKAGTWEPRQWMSCVTTRGRITSPETTHDGTPLDELADATAQSRIKLLVARNAYSFGR